MTGETAGPGAFGRDDIRYVVLVNAESRHSLWPEPLAAPAGWSVAFGAASRRACLEYVESAWTGLRPRMTPNGCLREAGAAPATVGG